MKISEGKHVFNRERAKRDRRYALRYEVNREIAQLRKRRAKHEKA